MADEPVHVMTRENMADRPETTPVIHSLDKVIAARGKTHGKFTDNADFAIETRELVREMSGWEHLSKARRLCVDEILLKLARALSADDPGADYSAIFRETFGDIEGYARIAKNDGDTTKC